MGTTDLVLWTRAAGGDAEAFGALFERHATTVYNYCHRRGADWAVAEDLTSVVFLEAWRRRAAFHPADADHVLPWLLRIAANVGRNQRRSLRRYRAALEKVPPAASEPDPAEAVAHRLDDRVRARRLVKRLERLPRRERDVILLCDWTGLSYEQAAIALDVPPGTVRSRLSRGRARLRRLAPDGDDTANDVGHRGALAAADEGGQ